MKERQRKQEKGVAAGACVRFVGEALEKKKL
jgi:hypothetical protein